jgi:hypothetical protein
MVKKKKKAVIGKCIYCSDNVEKELSDEHYLPRCLGSFKGFEMLNDRICNDHNNAIGQLEEQFCRSSEISLLRELLGVSGRKKHTTPSPFLRGSAGAPPLVMKGKFVDGDFEILYRLHRGQRTVDYMRQIVVFTDNGVVQIPIPDDMKTPEEFRTKLQEFGITQAKEARIFCAQSEIDWIKYLLSGVKFDNEIDFGRSPDKGRVHTITKIEVTNKHFRAVAKIGFHYFLKFMRQFYGSEDNFAEIRNFILNGGEVSNFVHVSENQIIAQVLEGYVPETYNHLLAARSNYKRLWCKLQFFLGPDYLPPVYIINLGESPSKIDYNLTYAHQFEYYRDGKHNSYDGELVEATSINRELLGQ